MIFGIIALAAAFVFTYALIHAINGKGRKEIWTAVSCISFAAMIGAMLYILMHIAEVFISKSV